MTGPSGTNLTRPPRFVEKMLSVVLPPGAVGRSMLGDLQEEYRNRGRSPATNLWYTLTALRLAGAYLMPGLIRLAGPLVYTVKTTVLGWTGDVRFALRSLKSQPTYLIASLLILGVGIGTASALFSVIYGAVLKPLPYPDAERLTRFGEASVEASAGSVWSISPANFLDLDEGVTSFENLAAYRYSRWALSGSDGPRRVLGMEVTADFFSVLGIGAETGRLFSASDDVDGAVPTVVLSNELWRTEWGGAASAIGGEIKLDGVTHVIIGVASRDFVFPATPELWRTHRWTAAERLERQSRSFEGIGRLKAGATQEVGLSDLKRVYGSLAELNPETNSNRTAGARGFSGWLVRSSDSTRLFLLGGAAALLLVIACANVMSLGLARNHSRNLELAVRTALGAGRARLARLLVAESLVVALASGAVGALVASSGTSLLVHRFGSSIPRSQHVSVDLVTIGFIVGLSLAIGVAVGITPILGPGARDLRKNLTQARGGMSREKTLLFRGLVVVEVALAVVLVSGSGLLVRSVWNLSKVDMGVDAGGVITFSLDLPRERYRDVGSFLRTYDAIQREIVSLPGVLFAGAQNRTFMQGGGNTSFEVPGQTSSFSGMVETRQITADLFEALGMRMLLGRRFSERDRFEGAPVIINEAFAVTFFADQSPVERTVRPGGSQQSFSIVGVVSDIRDFGPEDPARPTAYFAFGNGPWRSFPNLTFAVRTQGDPMSLIPTMRRRVQTIDADLPLANIKTMETIVTEQLGAARRSAFFLLNAFGLLALMMSAAGLFSVMSYGVAQRTHEVGVRMALGATAGGILTLVVKQGLALVALGSVVGTAVAIGLGQTLRGFLFGVSPSDPILLVVVPLVLFSVSLGACYLPARRAASIEPTQALKHE